MKTVCDPAEHGREAESKWGNWTAIAKSDAERDKIITYKDLI